MPRTRVKICGITNPRDAADAVACGADALGFVFHRGSARYIAPEQAAVIAASLPPFVTRVGLFVDEPMPSLDSILDIFPADLLQFHGDEPPDYCNRAGRSYIKALSATSPDGILARAGAYADASAILLDSAADGRFGGTGRVFDWDLVPPLTLPLVVAGGLTTGNVRDAIGRLRPYGVDVSSGVEKCRGIKDPEKMKAFMETVKAADRELA